MKITFDDLKGKTIWCLPPTEGPTVVVDFSKQELIVGTDLFGDDFFLGPDHEPYLLKDFGDTWGFNINEALL